jgi:hypothetical protein
VISNQRCIFGFSVVGTINHFFALFFFVYPFLGIIVAVIDESYSIPTATPALG